MTCLTNEKLICYCQFQPRWLFPDNILSQNLSLTLFFTKIWNVISKLHYLYIHIIYTVTLRKWIILGYMPIINIIIRKVLRHPDNTFRMKNITHGLTLLINTEIGSTNFDLWQICQEPVETLTFLSPWLCFPYNVIIFHKSVEE